MRVRVRVRVRVYVRGMRVTIPYSVCAGRPLGGWLLVRRNAGPRWARFTDQLQGRAALGAFNGERGSSFAQR